MTAEKNAEAIEQEVREHDPLAGPAQYAAALTARATNTDEQLLALPACPACGEEEWLTSYQEIAFVSYPVVGLTADGTVAEDENAPDKSDESEFWPEVVNRAPKQRVLRCAAGHGYTFEIADGHNITLMPVPGSSGEWDGATEYDHD